MSVNAGPSDEVPATGNQTRRTGVETYGDASATRALGVWAVICVASFRSPRGHDDTTHQPAAVWLTLTSRQGLSSQTDLEPGAALAEQRDLSAGRIERLYAMLDLIDRTTASPLGVIHMDKEEMVDIFGDFDPADHADEARERSGATEAYGESARRSAAYTKDDWRRFKRESDMVNAAVARLMGDGVDPRDPRALDVVERHRLLIDRWFYPCSREMHAELGRLYVTDRRFGETCERIRPGMADYLRVATAANAEQRRE